MKIKTVAISSISQDPANLRKHGERNIDAIVASLRKFGQQHPIVIDSKGIILSGNGRYMAAVKLGWTDIKVVESSLTGSAATAYAIADNRTAELAEWDTTALAETLRALQSEEFDTTAAGYSDGEIDALVEGLGSELLGADKEIVEDEIPEPPADPITKAGDLWILGEHRVLCGDSTNADDVARLMDGVKADLCFTSPPYGQQRDYTVEGKAKVQNWDGLMQGVFQNLPMSESGQVLVNLGLIHRDGEWIPYWDGWIEWMRQQGWKRFGWYVWDQGPGLPGDWNGRLAPSFEFVFHFNKLTVKPLKIIDCIHAGEKNHGSGLRAKDGDVQGYSHSGQNVQALKIPDSVLRIMRHKARGIECEHPAVFPVKLSEFISDCWPGDIYDPFLGSGTTLIAAQQLNRKCYGMEISPQYCDVIVKRWENLTGMVAVRESA
jgi:DNA modification methylase